MSFSWTTFLPFCRSTRDNTQIGSVGRGLIALLMAGFFVLSPLGGLVAQAAGPYTTVIASTEPGRVRLTTGGMQEVRLQLKNTGSVAWEQTGARRVSAYTWEPKYHVSPYRGPAWWSDHQAGQLMESRVEPGAVGTFVLPVYAPPGFTGALTETFRLAVEDTAWIEGGIFTITMDVQKADVIAPTGQEAAAAPDAEGYAAQILIRSAARITAAANEEVSYRIGVKNTGTKSWTGYALEDTHAALASTESPAFYHPSWAGQLLALARTDRTVDPGRLEMMTFTFRAPSEQGSYTAQFQVTVDGVSVPGGMVAIPVEVTSSAPALLDQPKTQELEQGPVVQGAQMEQPRVRVGIQQLTSEAVFTATTDVHVVESDLGYQRFVIPAGQAMRVNYNGSQYVFASGDVLFVADSYLRFEGTSVDTIFTVSSMSDIRSWNTSLNDNQFRDTLEIRYNPSKDRTWLINELPIEDYVYGVDESSNTAPEEYHKALITAARTYALYAWEHKDKYAGEFIELRSSTYDQVYRGYGAEVRRPAWVARTKATEGVTMQYGGEAIIAAYFSRSDGKTRNWKDVWGRAVPYAVSVPVPCEAGNTLLGHGVGMSAQGALCMAKDEGATFDQILTHFYTGIQLVDRW